MRELKFRGKEKIYNEIGGWLYGGILQQPLGSNGNYDIMIVQERNSWGDLEYVTVEPNTVCQFTGLHDKNGKEYEGDIVKRIELDGWKQTHIGTVEYTRDAKFVFVDKYKNTYDLVPVEELQFNHGSVEQVRLEYEVIGNKFDTTE